MGGFGGLFEVGQEGETGGDGAEGEGEFEEGLERGEVGLDGRGEAFEFVVGELFVCGEGEDVEAVGVEGGEELALAGGEAGLGNGWVHLFGI